MPPVPLAAGCRVDIGIPKALQNDLKTSVRYIYLLGAFGTQTVSNFQFDGDTAIVINQACANFIPINTGVRAVVKIKYLKNPDSVRDTENFIITVKDSTGNILAQTPPSTRLFMPALSFEPSQLMMNQVIPENNTVLEKGNWMIQFQVRNTLKHAVNPSLQLKVSSSFQLMPTCRFEALSSIIQDLNATCLVNRANYTILISNFTRAGQDITSLSGPVVFKLHDTIQNPFSAVTQIGNITLVTLTNKTEPVDSLTLTDPFQIVPGRLFNAEILFDPSVNFKPNPILKLKMIPQHTLVTDTQLQVKFIQFSQTGLSLNQQGQLVSCTNLLGPTGPVYQPCKVVNATGDELILTIDLNQNTPAMTLVQIEIQKLFERGPRFSGKMSTPIKVSSLVLKQIIDESLQINPVIDTPVDFLSDNTYITLASNVTSEPGSLIVNAVNSVPIVQGDVLTVEMSAYSFSLLVDLDSNVNCKLPLNCTVVSKQIGTNQRKVIEVRNISSLPNLKDIQIQGITNPPSTLPVGPLKLALLDSNSRVLHQSTATLMVQAKQAREVNSIKMIQTSTQPGVQVNYTFTIEQGKSTKFENGTEVVPWVKLTLPDCMTVVSGLSPQIFDHASGKIKLHKQVTASDLVFQLNSGLSFYSLFNLINPTESCQYKATRLSFEIRTYMDPNLTYPMDQKVVGLEPSLACNSPCGTCNIVEKSFCKSCVNKTQLLLKETGKCYDGTTCPGGFYQPKQFDELSQNECNQCDSGCQLCQDFTGICSKCFLGNLLNVTNNKCISRSQCDTNNGMFYSQDLAQCQECSSECSRCSSDSPLECTICKNSSLFLHSGRCVSECPEGFYSKKEPTTNQMQCKLRAPQTLFSMTTEATIEYVDSVISLDSAGSFVGQFPVLLGFLTPLILIRQAHEFGYHGNSQVEIFMLTFQVCEYMSLLAAFIKASMCANHIKYKTQLIAEYDFSQEKPLMQKVTLTDDGVEAPVLFIRKAAIAVALLVVALILAGHFSNELFYRFLVSVWDEEIKEDIFDELNTQRRSCICCLTPLSVMRYFNFMEFISLWRRRGWIIPAEHGIVRDQIQILFLRWMQFHINIFIFFKNFLLITLIFVMKYGQSFDLTEGNITYLFDMEKLSNLPAQKQVEYKDFMENMDRSSEFVANALVECCFFASFSLFLAMKWLRDATLKEIESRWGDDDFEPDSEEEEEEEEEEPSHRNNNQANNGGNTRRNNQDDSISDEGEQQMQKGERKQDDSNSFNSFQEKQEKPQDLDKTENDADDVSHLYQQPAPVNLDEDGESSEDLRVVKVNDIDFEQDSQELQRPPEKILDKNQSKASQLLNMIPQIVLSQGLKNSVKNQLNTQRSGQETVRETYRPNR